MLSLLLPEVALQALLNLPWMGIPNISPPWCPSFLSFHFCTLLPSALFLLSVLETPLLPKSSHSSEGSAHRLSLYHLEGPLPLSHRVRGERDRGNERVPEQVEFHSDWSFIDNANLPYKPWAAYHSLNFSLSTSSEIKVWKIGANSQMNGGSQDPRFEILSCDSQSILILWEAKKKFCSQHIFFK